MSKESIVLVLGVVVFLTPYLGIPGDWKSYLSTGVGIVLVFVGYLLRRKSYLRSIDNGSGERVTDTFVENTKAIDFSETEE